MIYVLLGATCSGKTTLLKQLTELGYKSIISYTTRPKRPNEVDGKDYHFITDDQYKEMAQKEQLVAKNYFLNAFGTFWFYGINIEDLNTNENLLVITEPKGYRDLIKKLGKEKVTGIYLKTGCQIRLARGISRSDVLEELLRRLLADEYDFKDFEKEVDYVITETDKDKIVSKVVSILEEEK